MYTDLPYIRYRVGHFYKSIQFEFIYILYLYRENDSELKCQLESLSIFRDIIFDIAINVIYFNLSTYYSRLIHFFLKTLYLLLYY